MSLTRIQNNQITDSSSGNIYLGVNAASKVQDYSITSGKIQNNLVYGSDFTIAGNLTVQGNTTTIDTVNLVVEDPLILLAKEQTGSPALDIGFIGKRGTSDNIAFVWDESQAQFVTVFTTSETTNTTITINSYASLKTLDMNVTGNLDVTGNISFTGNVTSLNVTGNINSGNVLTPGVASAGGNVTGANLNTGGVISATGTITGGNVATAGTVSATGTATLGNVATGGTVSATGNVTGGNVLTGGLVSATGNVTGGNLITSGIATVTGTVTAGNVATAGTVSATGNVTGGNVLTSGLISSTGNVTSGNVSTGIITASGNVTGANFYTAGEVSATGNVYGNNVIATEGVFGNVDVSGDITVNSLTSNTFVSATANVIGGNITTSGIISATGTATLGNVDTSGNVSATGNVTGGNVLTGGYVSATGNLVGGNVTTAGVVSATGTITGGNLATGGTVSATGTATVGNLATGGTVSATGNVTGGNVLTSGLVSASGNIAGNNISAGGFVSAVGNVIAPTVVTTTVTTSSGDLFLSSAGGNLQWDGTGNIVMNNQWINNLADPVAAYDAATKQYVDDAVSSGITVHTPVYLEAPVALPAATYTQGGTTATVTDTIAGNTVVFSSAINPQVNDQYWFTNSFSGIVANTAYFVVSAPNTSAAVLSTTYNGSPVSNISNATGLTQAVRVNSGIGATLTGNTNAALSVDGVAVTVNDRILVYNQTPAYENGVYVVTQTGNISAPYILTRSTDTDVYGPKSTTELDVGDYFYVQAGNTGAGESYVMTAPTGPFIIGYDGITFTQFSASQVYTANTAAGLVLNGTIFSAKVDNDTTAFDGGGNIVVKASANLTTPNIGAATGSSLSLLGNVVSANVNTGIMSATGDVIGGNVLTGGYVSATGNITGNYYFGNGSQLTGVAAASVDANNLVGNTLSANVLFSSLTTVGSLTSLSVVGTTTTGNLDTGGTVSATGNVTGGNVLTGGLISATGTATAGNLATGGTVSATGTITGGNVATGGTVSATGTATVGNLATAGTVSATGNVTGGNVLTGGYVSATGNVSGNNFSALGNVAATGFTGGNASVTGNVYAANFIGNISGNIDAAGSNTQVQFNDTTDQLGASANFTFDKATNIMSVTGTIEGTTVSATGNVIAGNVSTAGLVTATGNVTGGNVLTGGLISATGNATAANLILTSGTIDGPASGIINVNGSGIDTDFAVNGDTTANIMYIDAGVGTVSFGNSGAITNAIVSFNTTDSVLMPVGNTNQRPNPATIGMLRFNSVNDGMEVYTSVGWAQVGEPDFTVIVADSFTGNGVQTIFTLSEDSTTAGTIVSINGVVQEPTTAYSVAGNALTFTEAPSSSDSIDARILTTTKSVVSISNGSGNARIDVSETSDTVQITGNLLPAANVTYDLGSNTKSWRNGYFSGSTIFLGNLQLKQVDSSTFGVFKSDGTTAANVDVGSIDVSSIIQGTSEIGIASLNGNAYITVGGQSNTLVVGQTLSTLTGSFSVTGNVIAQDVNSLSDATLKTNINPLTGVESVIHNLTGVQYDWKNGSGHSYGFLAQEVERVLPDAVKTGADGLKAINYQMIIPFLVETIKQMGAEIQDLKRAVTPRRRKQ